MHRPQAYPQAGILNRPSEHVLLLALQFRDRSAAVPAQAIEALRGVVRKELTSDLDILNAGSDKTLPPTETGELGFDDGYDRAHLTITLGISSGGFEALGIPLRDRPQDLIPIPWQALGDSPEVAESGDLILQVCADSTYVTSHVERRIREELASAFAVLWTLPGVQRYTSRAGRTSREEGRALIGFLDGTSNLHPRHSDEDRALVFVNPDGVGAYPPLPPAGQPGYGGGAVFPADLRVPPTAEPPWTREGTYMTVRASVNDIDRWDDQTLGGQEQTIGRFKWSGASLDLADDRQRVNDEPAYAADPSSLVVPVDSHTRKVNPRRPEDEPRRLLRRGYPLIRPVSGGVERGLVFIAFGRTISTQFEFVVRAWMRNADFPSPGAGIDRLLAFDIRVLGGGYYFAPALDHQDRAWTWILPTSAPNG